MYFLIFGNYKQSWSLIADKHAPDGIVGQQKTRGPNKAVRQDFLINSSLPAEDD